MNENSVYFEKRKDNAIDSPKTSPQKFWFPVGIIISTH